MERVFAVAGVIFAGMLIGHLTNIYRANLFSLGLYL